MLSPPAGGVDARPGEHHGAGRVGGHRDGRRSPGRGGARRRRPSPPCRRARHRPRTPDGPRGRPRATAGPLRRRRAPPDWAGRSRGRRGWSREVLSRAGPDVPVEQGDDGQAPRRPRRPAGRAAAATASAITCRLGVDDVGLPDRVEDVVVGAARSPRARGRHGAAPAPAPARRGVPRGSPRPDVRQQVGGLAEGEGARPSPAEHGQHLLAVAPGHGRASGRRRRPSASVSGRARKPEGSPPRSLQHPGTGRVHAPTRWPPAVPALTTRTRRQSSPPRAVTSRARVNRSASGDRQMLPVQTTRIGDARAQPRRSVSDAPEAGTNGPATSGLARDPGPDLGRLRPARRSVGSVAAGTSPAAGPLAPRSRAGEA